MTELFILPIKEVEELTEEYCLSHFPVRYEKAQRFRFHEDYLRCVAAGELLVRAGILEEDIFLGPRGKPLVKDKFFNLSHSGDFAVLAVSDTDVGVDIERSSRSNMTVARKVFTDDELSWVGDDVSRFTHIWTLKEAVIKMIGDGLSLPLESFSVLDLVHSNVGVINGISVKSYTKQFDDYFISYVEKN